MRFALALLLLAAAPRAEAMFPPTSAAQVGLSSVPRGLATGTPRGLGLSNLFRYSERIGDAGQRSETLRHSLIVDYGVAQRWTAVAILPYVRNESRSGGVTQRASGLGDLALLGKYAVYQDHRLMDREIQLIAGLELPTGYDDAKDAAGQRLPLTLQPGSDSLDALAGAAMIWSYWKVALYGDALYKRHGRESYSFGDSVGVNAGANLPLGFAPKFSLSAELNFEWADREELMRVALDGVLNGLVVD